MLKKIHAWGLCMIAIVALSGCGAKDEKIIDLSDSEGTLPIGVPFEKPANASPITGLACEHFDKRPYAIMYSGDTDARAYFTNLSQADAVVEMPHRPMHGQPRLMGIFQCNAPTQIGPMRSGRVDHISLAGAFDAIYVPWGKSAFAGVLLSEGAVDSINCDAVAGSGACFLDRTVQIRSANPAFSNMPELISLAAERGFRSESQLTSFSHQGETPLAERPQYGQITVGFADPYRTHFVYDRETNAYQRYVNDQPDIDFATKQHIAPKNVVVIPAKKDGFRTDIDYVSQGLLDPWRGISLQKKEELHNQYPNFALGDPWYDTLTQGQAYFYMNGVETVGTWKRDNSSVNNPFEFYDAQGRAIRFVPGQIWIAVPEDYRTVKYRTEPDDNVVPAAEPVQ